MTITAAREEVGTPTMRAQALRTVLAAAPTVGIEMALASHGTVLTRDDRLLVANLTESELADLSALSGEMSELDVLSVDTNNNL